METLAEKIGIMNKIGLELADKMLKTSENIYDNIPIYDLDDIWAVADGLSENYVMRAVNCEGSINFILENTPEVIEKYIDTKIINLNRIKTEYFD